MTKQAKLLVCLNRITFKWKLYLKNSCSVFFFFLGLHIYVWKWHGFSFSIAPMAMALCFYSTCAVGERIIWVVMEAGATFKYQWSLLVTKQTLSLHVKAVDFGFLFLLNLDVFKNWNQSSHALVFNYKEVRLIKRSVLCLLCFSSWVSNTCSRTASSRTATLITENI